MTRALRTADDLARGQGGHFTRTQAQLAGIHRSTLIRWVDAGGLVPVGWQTFRLASVPRSVKGDVLAVCLDLDGVAAYWTAAWLHRLVDARPIIDVLVRTGQRHVRPRRVGPEQPHVRVHVTTNLPTDDVVVVDGIPTTGVARSMLGLAALVPGELGPRGLFDLVGKSVDAGLATDPWLWWHLSNRRCRGRNGVVALESALAERARLGPTESWLEREALRVLEEAGLPLPHTQRVFRRRGRFAARVDFIYEPDLIIEVLGYAFHRTADQMASDIARANELQLLGNRVLQFTARQVVSSTGTFVTTIRAALEGPRQVAS